MNGFSCSPGLIMAENCIPHKNETNCAQFATGRVSDCRHADAVPSNSVYSRVVHRVRAPCGTQSDFAVCLMFSCQ